MRKKEYLKKPNLCIKEYKVKNFEDITEYSLHVNVGEKITTNKISLKYYCSQVGTMIKSYFVGNRLFVLMKNLTTYEYVSKVLRSKRVHKVEPLMIDVLINGSPEILVIESATAYIFDTSVKFSFPYGTSIAKYDGRLFVAKEKNIYYHY